MRIGLDYRAATLAPGSGPARQVLALERALRRRPDTETVLFTEAPLDHPHRAIAVAADLPAAASTGADASAGAGAGLRRRWRFEAGFLPAALRAEQVDVYIAAAEGGLPVWRKPASVRQVLLLHDLFKLTLRRPKSSPLRALAARMLDEAAIGHSIAGADAIWTPSRYTTAECGRLYPSHAHKLYVLPDAVAPMPAPAERSRLGQPLPPRYWLLVGTREPRRNADLFLRAWLDARRQHYDTPDLVVVGSPADVPAELQRLNGVHWFERAADDELARLYYDAERLWQPSYAEGFGLPVLEALFAGTPVAVAEGGALEEVAPVDMPRFDPHDRPQLAQLMIRLSRESVVGNAEQRRAFAQRFAPNAYAARVGALLDELLKRSDR
ncbi:glycosyltransferase family 4 protein [Lysobacter enzymogenes]|uniref:Glycosyltransferase family 1 protein n=1 Tax=Lysobacter enzymogenes TaxID=69 RepID=A0A3N2RM42_LYSEN|nr:glycosyltransferase family 1 protein [Lysobacter enzymogenes]ROU08489.1 glycosyltransferase family 1 protein [Lysobacter enzymogenes]